jgi:hypothetical protein
VTVPYKSPRRINFVSLFLFLVLIGGAYAGWKFIPPYWQAWKVDEVLREARNEASDISTLDGDRRTSREHEVLDRTRRRILDLGIVDQPDYPIQLEFSPSYDMLYCRYRVIVRHVVGGKTTVLDMNRKVSMPTNKDL